MNDGSQYFVISAVWDAYFFETRDREELIPCDFPDSFSQSENSDVKNHQHLLCYRGAATNQPIRLKVQKETPSSKYES
jgi:hypothetical protein